jgi:hypothetical protein
MLSPPSPYTTSAALLLPPARVRVSVRIRVCMHVRVHLLPESCVPVVYGCACLGVWVGVRVCVCARMYVSVRVCMRVCMCVCV